MHDVLPNNILSRSYSCQSKNCDLRKGKLVAEEKAGNSPVLCAAHKFWIKLKGVQVLSIEV